MRSILLAMLLGCGDQIETMPDAMPDTVEDSAMPIEPSCTVTRESIEPAPAPLGECLVNVAAEIVCSPGPYDRMLIGWIRLSDMPRTAGLAEVTYQCNEKVSARFSVPCDGPTDVGAAIQHPQLGGDLYVDTDDAAPRITCELIP